MTDADIARARAEFLEDLARLKSEQDLQALRDKYLGRKGGVLTALMKSVAAAPQLHMPAFRRPSARRPLIEFFYPSLLHLSLYADEAGETATIILALTKLRSL